MDLSTEEVQLARADGWGLRTSVCMPYPLAGTGRTLASLHNQLIAEADTNPLYEKVLLDMPWVSTLVNACMARNLGIQRNGKISEARAGALARLEKSSRVLHSRLIAEATKRRLTWPQ